MLDKQDLDVLEYQVDEYFETQWGNIGIHFNTVYNEDYTDGYVYMVVYIEPIPTHSSITPFRKGCLQYEFTPNFTSDVAALDLRSVCHEFEDLAYEVQQIIDEKTANGFKRGDQVQNSIINHLISVGGEEI